MADTPQQQTDPLKPGSQTSEFKLTVGTMVGVAGALLAGALVTVNQLKDVFPGAAALVTVAAILGTAATAVGTVAKFIGSRTTIKVASLQADAVAAQVAQAVGTAPTGLPRSP